MKSARLVKSTIHNLLITTPLLLASGTFAIPIVSTVPLGSNDCARWPGFVDFDYTSPVHLVVDSADNTTANGLLTTLQGTIIPGTNVDGTNGASAIRLIVSLPNLESTTSSSDSPQTNWPSAYLHPTYRCESGQLHFNIPVPDPGSTIAGRGTSDIISVHRDYQNAFPILGEEGLRIAPYHHEIDGVEGEDVYLGTRGRTTWGFHYVDDDTGFFEIALQGGSPDEYDGVSVKGNEPDFYGFLKVVPVEK